MILDPAPAAIVLRVHDYVCVLMYLSDHKGSVRARTQKAGFYRNTHIHMKLSMPGCGENIGAKWIMHKAAR